MVLQERGQPLWGYKSQRLVRGQDKRGRSIIKSVWTLDDSIVAGRTVHEWVRHCLVDLAVAGASLAERDFCNRTGIPGRRNAYWGLSTWNALLQASVILQYCEYGVWNAGTKEGREPAVGMDNRAKCSPALISEDEARAVLAARRRAQSTATIPTNRGRSLTFQYLLSGASVSAAARTWSGFVRPAENTMCAGTSRIAKAWDAGLGRYIMGEHEAPAACRRTRCFDSQPGRSGAAAA